MRPMNLLTRISDALAAWDEQRETGGYRAGGVLVGLAVAGAILAAPTPAGLSLEGQQTAAVAVLMALWWVGGVLPMAVTAMLPVVAFPILGVATVAEAAAPYAHKLNVLMLGGFVLGHAMEKVGLHERLTSALLRPAWVRASPHNVVLALMVSAALLSGLVSNTATTLMLLPLAVSLARRCTDDRRAQTGFVLALAYASSIGGVTTLVGTPPNAVFAGIAADDLGREVSFASWMRVGVPFAIIALPLAWLVITRVAIPLRGGRAVEAPQTPAWTRSEALVLAVVGAAMALWLSRALPVHDAWVAITAALVCFVLPGDDRPFLLDWREAEQALPWSVLLLLGGGFSLAATIKASGLTAWAAGGLSGLALLPPALAVLVLCLGMTFLTELTSNTATTQIVLPLLAAAATASQVDPFLWMVPATISASCAFMMPVATAPNAIASEAGGVAPGDMAWAGLLLNLLCVGVASGVCLLLL